MNGQTFHRACRGALNCPLIVHAAQRVMLCLLDAANQDAEVYLGQLEIARRLGLTDRAVRTSLKRLSSAGWIDPMYAGRARPGQRRWATRFKIHLDKLIEFDPQPEADFQSCDIRDRKSSVTQPEVQGNETGSPALRDRKRTSSNRLIDRLNTDSKTEDAAAPPGGRSKPVKLNAVLLAVEIPASLNVPQFCELWTEWVLERKARGKSLTTRAAKMQLATLEAMGPTAAMASIRQSIEKGWTGLFEPKDSNGRPAAVVHNDVEF